VDDLAELPGQAERPPYNSAAGATIVGSNNSMMAQNAAKGSTRSSAIGFSTAEESG
jgi:hypothetical protein